MFNNTGWGKKVQKQGIPILCSRCNKPGGTLRKIGDDYIHDICLRRFAYAVHR